MMKTFGIVSYNIHCNFTDYGSALESLAFSRTLEGTIELEFSHLPAQCAGM